MARLFAGASGGDVDAGVGAALAAMLAEGRETWPRASVSEEAFVAHVARHAGGDPGGLATLRASDLYLACGCAQKDKGALAYLEERFIAHVPEYVLRIRIDGDAVDEVQQTLRERLVLGGKIGEYTGRGALGGWLRVAAVRTALNQLRGRRDLSLDPEAGGELALAADPELAFLKERTQGLFVETFKRVVAGLEPAERAMLRLHYVDGLTMDQLARLYQTPRSTVARRIANVRQAVLEATEGRLRDERKLSPSAVASVIRQARSQIHLTMSRIWD